MCHVFDISKSGADRSSHCCIKYSKLRKKTSRMKRNESKYGKPTIDIYDVEKFHFIRGNSIGTTSTTGKRKKRVRVYVE